ncbi:MAG: hydrogenase iron-sulfur subunit [Bradymonadaceae bacterium]
MNRPLENNFVAHDVEDIGDRDWEPRIIALACKWCTCAGANMAGTLRLKYPTNVHILQLPCTGQVNALYLLKAFEEGADGIVVSGCHPGDCHYGHGNMLARRRATMMRRLMHLIGLEPRRLQFAWVSAAEGAKWAEMITDVVEEVRELGPIGTWPRTPRPGSPSLVLPEADRPPRSRPDADSMASVTSHLREKARDLLQSGEARQVIGYRQGPLVDRVVPALISDAEDASSLHWDETCHSNLTVYLTGKEQRPKDDQPGKTVVIVKPCDAKTIIALEQESQLDRDDIIVLSPPCEGVWSGEELAAKCYDCGGGHSSLGDWKITADGVFPGDADVDELPLATAPDPRKAELDALWEASPAERWDFWQEQFRHCLRCDGCRSVCPLCYCDSCVSEKNQPQWISPAADPLGNTAWNFIRAYHLVGRCVGCDECSRVCPADIRLDLVNLAMAREVEERFDYRSGHDPTVAPPLATFNPDDPEEFIR